MDTDNTYNVEDLVSDESFIAFCRKEKDADYDFWNHWIANHPEKGEEIELAKYIVQNLSLELPQEEYEKEKSKLLAHLNAHNHKTGRTIHLSSWKYIARVAAIILFPVVGLLIYNQINLNEEPVASIADEHVVKQTSSGQKSTIFLSDGSKVILNSESKIEYSKNFTGPARLIELTGEAFFEVAKDAHKPFIVSVNSIQTTALGTSFNIRAFDDREEVEIALITGKVSVRNLKRENTEDDVLLMPGEAVSYTAEKAAGEKFLFNAKRIVSWKEGLLYFDQASFTDVIVTLERWYGVTIDVNKKGAFRSKHYSGEFDNKSLEFVLNALSYTNDFDYKINGKSITITP